MLDYNQEEMNDQKYKELFDTYESPYSNQVWSGVQAALIAQQKTKRRRILWWSSLAIAGFISLTALIHSDYTKHKKSQGKIEADLKKEILATNQTLENQFTTGTLDELNPDQVSNITESFALTYTNQKSTAKKQTLEAAFIGADKTLVKENLMIPAPNASAVNTVVDEPNLLQPTRFSNSIRSDIAHDAPNMNGGYCLNFKTGPKFTYFFDVFGSLDYFSKAMSTTNTEIENYLTARSNTENTALSYSFGFRFSAYGQRGLGIKTGMQYSFMNEKFSYIDPNSSQIRTITIKDYIYSNGIIVDSTVRTEEIVIDGEKRTTAQNSYRTLDIPLLLSYQFGGHGRFYYQLNGGLIFNILSARRGLILDENQLPTHLSNYSYEEAPGFKTKMGSSLMASVSIHYWLTKDFDLMVEPYFRTTLQEINTTTNPIRQNHRTSGLMVGIRYQF